MSLFHFFRRGSAPIARERLQVLLAHERVACDRPDLLSILREEILAVIGRHVSFEPERCRSKWIGANPYRHSRSTSRFQIAMSSVRCGLAVTLAVRYWGRKDLCAPLHFSRERVEREKLPSRHRLRRPRRRRAKE